MPTLGVQWTANAGRGASRGPIRRDANGDIIYSAGLRSLADLRDDDKAAAEEAAAQNGRPGYCGELPRCSCMHLAGLFSVVNIPLPVAWLVMNRVARW